MKTGIFCFFANHHETESKMHLKHFEETQVTGTLTINATMQGLQKELVQKWPGCWYLVSHLHAILERVTGVLHTFPHHGSRDWGASLSPQVK